MDPSPHQDVVDTYRAVGVEIDDALRAADRPLNSVTLVAVSKTHGSERVLPLLVLGHRQFGENRVQEASAKRPALKEAYPSTQLHLIGPLQTNKVRHALMLFDVIESVDRPRLAESLANEMARSNRRPTCLIQVNVGEEPQKAGIGLAEADRFIEECLTRWSLPVTGLMCIPPAGRVPRPYFDALARLATNHGLVHLSMGMSGDFASAIAAGATHVRLGSALFGHRPFL